jgi:hypothetical protein
LAPNEQQAMSENRNEWPPDHRGVIAWLRDIAAECRFKGERSEFSQLAEIFRSPIADRRGSSCRL